MAAGEARTVKDCLQQGWACLAESGSPSARLDAELILAQVLAWERTALWLRPDQALNRRQKVRFSRLIARRLRGEPVAYILRRKEFWSLELEVTPSVMIPRPETETLVEAALEQTVSGGQEGLSILELGTGSGAVAVALARELKQATLWATDKSARALTVAYRNACKHGVADRIKFLQGNLFAPVSHLRGFFYMILSNPPYVPSEQWEQLPVGVREFEPRRALDGGSGGIEIQRRIISQSPAYLKPGGRLMLELGAGQEGLLSELVDQTGCFAPVRFKKDLAGRNRVLLTCKRE